MRSLSGIAAEVWSDMRRRGPPGVGPSPEVGLYARQSSNYWQRVFFARSEDPGESWTHFC